MEYCDVLIVGGGVAGIMTAKSIAGKGMQVCLVDTKSSLGGILLQCFHHGFGQGKDGPTYIQELTSDFPDSVRVLLHTTVLSVSEEKVAHLIGTEIGEQFFSFDQLVLATGCYEIPIGALPVAGTRPNGIYTAGQMQEMINLYGFNPKGPIVILGSGDLGLIMAAQLGKIGIDVTIIEKKACCGGLKHNQNCLNLRNIHLICQNTVQEIYGKHSLIGVRLTNGVYLPCKTLLVAVGLRPEQSLAKYTDDKPWLHFCGNCHKVQAMVEGVIREGKEVGRKVFYQWREDND